MILYYLIIALTFLVDQLSKIMIRNSFDLYQKKEIIKNFFYLTFVENTGAAWSLLSGGRWFFVSVTSVMLIALFISLFKIKHKLFRSAAAIIIGGGFGNLLDRILYGQVTDFLDTYFWDYDFPVFNLSDSFVVIGTILLGVYILKFKGAKMK